MPKGSVGKAIKVKRIKVPTDPSIEIFEVSLEDEESEWRETIPTEEALRWFFRGIQAGASTFGNQYVALPDVPRNSVLFGSENPEPD